MATYFNDHLSPVMRKVRNDLTEKQVEEMREYKKSHIGRMHDVRGSMYNLSDDSVDVLRRTGEWNSKSTEDYVEMCREEIASSSAIRSDLTLLADEWRNTLVREVGKERYDDISTKLGNDLALAYVDYRMEQLMIERMVTERMPKSSLEYIIREASSNSLLGISHAPFQSPLDTEIERRSETAYQPGIAEKGIGRALAFGADMVATGGPDVKRPIWNSRNKKKEGVRRRTSRYRMNGKEWTSKMRILIWRGRRKEKERLMKLQCLRPTAKVPERATKTAGMVC